MSEIFLTHDDLAPLLKRLDAQDAEAQAQEREIDELRARIVALEEVIGAETMVVDNGLKRRQI